MKKLLYIFSACCIVISANAQRPGTSKTQGKVKTKTREETLTNLEIGPGVMGSVLYLTRNINDKNDALGYSVSANYGGTKLTRVSVQYTYYKKINIEPTWYDIQAQTIEANLEVLARFKNNKSFLYPFAGFSYNTFKGLFTGINDYQGLYEIYEPNTIQKERWLGFNIGTGFEHTIGPIVIFLDYRMRVGQSGQRGIGSSGINIMDVCYGGGIRYKLQVPTLKKIYRGINDKYHWF